MLIPVDVVETARERRDQHDTEGQNSSVGENGPQALHHHAAIVRISPPNGRDSLGANQ